MLWRIALGGPWKTWIQTNALSSLASPAPARRRPWSCLYSTWPPSRGTHGNSTWPNSKSCNRILSWSRLVMPKLGPTTTPPDLESSWKCRSTSRGILPELISPIVSLLLCMYFGAVLQSFQLLLHSVADLLEKVSVVVLKKKPKKK